MLSDPATGDGPPSALDTVPPLGEPAFRKVVAIMQRDARIHLPDTKVTLVQSRLGKMLRRLQLPDFETYLARIETDAEERRQMVTALTTNHTSFFREGHHFDHLRTHVLPQLKGEAPRRPIRIWSAGSSSGEEAYSIAMTLLGQDQAQAEWLRTADVRILATDIAQPMVEAVIRGCYAEAAVAPVPEAMRRRWMTPDGNGWSMGDRARQLVAARVLNLFDPWPMRQQYDVIFCRNVMIYFDEPAKAELTERLCGLLRPGGTLYIGHSERLTGKAAAMTTGCGHTIYRRHDAS